MKDGRYYSRHFNGYVWVRVDKEQRDCYWGNCEACGKMIKNYIAVTPESDGIEYIYGSECVKKLGLQLANSARCGE